MAVFYALPDSWLFVFRQSLYCLYSVTFFVASFFVSQVLEVHSAGANVVQLYTGMIDQGPGVVKKIKKELIEILKKEKIKNISDAIGINS